MRVCLSPGGRPAASRRDRGDSARDPAPRGETSDAEDWEEALDDPEAGLYTVGVVADLMDVSPQVVRGYDKRGLVSPERSGSGPRRYSRRDIRRLARAMDLADEGIASTGIERILELEDRLAEQRDDTGAGSSPAGRGAPREL